MNLAQDIKKFFKGEVDDSAATLDAYSRDASVFCVRPELVVFPKDIDDVKNLVAYASAACRNGADISLTARSAGTDMSGGPLTESVVVEFTKYFNNFVEIGHNYAIVEPGMYYRDFEKKTLEAGLLMPSYPASRELCTVGGMVANNSGGEKTLSYGKTERYVEELNIMLADGNEYVFRPLSAEELAEKKLARTFEGEIYRKMSALIEGNRQAIAAAKPQVTKNSSGYFLWNVVDAGKQTFNLAKLIVGSQGTLGFVTKIKFSLVRPKPFSRMLVIFLKDLSPLADLTKQVLACKPESFESYDDNTFRIAIRFFPEIIEQIKGSIFRLALSLLPEAWMVLCGGIPKLVLLAEFTADTPEDANAQAAVAGQQLKKTFPSLKMRVTRSDEETEEFWLIRRESFNLLRHHVRGLRTAPFIDDLVVRPDLLPEFLPKLYAILGRYKLLYTIAGHVGDGNFHIIPLMDFTDPGIKDVIVTLSKEVYALVGKYKGSITGEHNDGLIRTPFVKEEFGEQIYGLFEETKKIFDPDDIFNPGKKVGATLEYALAHLDMEKKN
ncbi:MAG: FAD-binding oxidoreductase [Candidatus Sungbacteria bacterium]|nr:FAD-binding oxidoreductase [Candidatus Sungbacteria bacterium]